MSSLRKFVLALAVVAGATPVRADDALVRVTNTLVGEWHADNNNAEAGDDNYAIMIERLNLAASTGGISTLLRLDGMYTAEPPTDGFEDDLRVERLRVRYRLGNWSIEVGDFYQQVGRGIALSLRKVHELGVDVTIRGGRVEYDGDVHVAELFAGRANPSNLDTVSQEFVAETGDVIAGGRYGFRVFDRVEIGAYGVHVDPTEAILPTEGDDRATTVGGYIEMPDVTEWMSFYGEGAYQTREVAGDAQSGEAGYGALDFGFTHWAILTEGLYLKAFEQRGSTNSALNNRFFYNQPPTLERIDQEVIDNRDTLGGRVRVERFLLDGRLVLRVNGMLRFEEPGQRDEIRKIHTFGGFEYSYQGGRSRLSMSAGWRGEEQKRSGQFRDIKSMRHAELDVVQAIGAGWAIHLTSTNELRTLDEADYERGSTLAGVEKSGLGALTFELGYDTQDPRDGVRNVFYAGVLSWHPASAVELRTTVGTQRGGIKCINGVCRDFPEFAGVGFELVGRTTLGG